MHPPRARIAKRAWPGGVGLLLSKLSMAAETTADPASLDRLHDLIVPAPVPWWPPAPGWYGVLAIALVLVLVLALRALRRYLRNAYRREALATLETAGRTPFGLATLLKRVALTAYPREQVAALTGTDWLAFLDRTGNTREFTQGPAQRLVSDVYRNDPQTDPTPSRDTLAAARRWIRRHTPPC